MSEKTRTAKLLPCPFCGHSSLGRVHVVDAEDRLERYEIHCWVCPAKMSSTIPGVTEAWWNRRAKCACLPDEESPEWTEDEFKRAEPAPSFLARILGKVMQP